MTFEEVKRDAIILTWPEFTEVVQEIYDDASIVADQEYGDNIHMYSSHSDTDYTSDDVIERLATYFGVGIITCWAISEEILIFLYV